MDTIFQLPLFIFALLQLLLALLLLLPNAISLPVCGLLRSCKANAGSRSVLYTLALVLLGLIISSVLELTHGAERAQRADMREVVHTIDYLRAQVSCVLSVFNLLLLFVSPALAEVKCAHASAVKNLDAMQRQVKGLQAEYQRVTSAPAAGGAAGAEGGSGEVEALKKQVDKLIREKQDMQASVDAADKAKASAEASVSAMKSQLKGFDAEFDRLLDENKVLKRRLAVAGDAAAQAEVQREVMAQAGRSKDD